MVAFVQKSTSVGQFLGTNSATPGAMSAGATANNLLILPFVHQQFDNQTQTETATGFSAANSVIEAFDHIAQAGCLYKVAVGGETNATLTNTTAGTAGNSFGDTVLAEFSGLSASSPYVSADSNTATGNLVTSMNVSSSNPLSESSGVAVVAFSGEIGFTGATWPPSGWQSLDTDTGNGALIAYLIFSSNAQLTAGFGTISSANNVAATVTIFKATVTSNKLLLLN